MYEYLVWERSILSNGMRVLLFPQLSGITMQLAIAVEYGSNLDSEDSSGTAHFLEHMLPGGSTKRIDLSRGIERLGGSSDYITTYEYTISIADITPEKSSKVSNILSTLIYDSSFEQDKFELERKIILNEIREAADNPNEKVTEMLKQCLFKTHPIRQPICGTRKTVNQLSIARIKEAYKAHYIPPNMIMILTGKFRERDAETILRDFGDNYEQNPAPKKKSLLETCKPKKEVNLNRLGISQTYLSTGVRTVPINHPDICALDLINALIGSNTCSRLFIELREKRALAYSVHSIHECGSDYGYFHIDCAVRLKNLGKATNLIHREVQKIKTEKVSKNELDQGKDIVKGEILRALNSPSDCLLVLAEMEMWFNSENAIQDYFKKIDEVTPADISEIANKYLNEEEFSIATIKPKE